MRFPIYLLVFLCLGTFGFTVYEENGRFYLLDGRHFLKAAEKGDVNAVLRFLKKGGDVNYKPPGDTALCKAIEGNQDTHSENAWTKEFRSKGPMANTGSTLPSSLLTNLGTSLDFPM